MILHSPSLFPQNHSTALCSSSHNDTSSSAVSIPSHYVIKQSNSIRLNKINKDEAKPFRCCSCGRRHFLETSLLSAVSDAPANASGYKATMNKVRPPRPDWYEELYASVLNSDMMNSYEAEIAAYKSQLFANLRGKAKKVLEIGIGTGPNLKYYGNDDDVEVFGVDPNGKMVKYAQKAAEAAGLPPANFKFIQAVGEAIPLSDASVDAVVGTLVLCSVTNVDQTLQEVKRVLRPGGLYLFVEHVAAKEGTFLRFVQNLLDPLQQTVADGCHLTRETGKKISEAGFSGVDLNTTFLSKTAFINPQVYGIASK
ncbi:putative methyltransferase-like protein 7A [Ricinus communis]|uniref:putative methyltransferase-like protein 7A n=1 Tax=Ricinus communis TaxID=3988 RepID=UPI00201A5FF0|nr:putative methyltransferase-like protein 7A [Ricinus communis]